MSIDIDTYNIYNIQRLIGNSDSSGLDSRPFATERKVLERTDKRSNEKKIQLSFFNKKDDKITEVLEKGKMVAVLSGMEIMYVIIFRNEYRCFIHKFDAEEGRQKAFSRNSRNTAMLNNLDSAADQLFVVEYEEGMDIMGVMVAAEKGIISYLDHTGQLPAEDMDFMSWQEPEDQKEEKQ